MEQAFTPPPPPGAPLPREARRWNWGAFLLTWIWGLGNNTFIALLALVPLVGLVMHFVLGAKGNEWAWRNGRWDSLAHFRRVQRRWAQWGVAVWLAALMLAGTSVGGFFYLFKHTEPYTRAAAQIESSPEVAQVFGRPIATGFPLGTISVEGSQGRAALRFSVTGPKAKGTATVVAVKQGGAWTFTVLHVEVDGSGDVIDILNPIHADARSAHVHAAGSTPWPTHPHSV